MSPEAEEAASMDMEVASETTTASPGPKILTIQEVNDLFLAWVQANWGKVTKAWLLAGGWEHWAAVDFALFVRERHETADILTEQHVYGNARNDCDVLVNHNTASDRSQVIVVELKAQTLASGSSFPTLALGDHDRLGTVSTGPNGSPDFRAAQRLAIAAFFVKTLITPALSPKVNQLDEAGNATFKDRMSKLLSKSTTVYLRDGGTRRLTIAPGVNLATVTDPSHRRALQAEYQFAVCTWVWSPPTRTATTTTTSTTGPQPEAHDDQPPTKRRRLGEPSD